MASKGAGSHPLAASQSLVVVGAGDERASMIQPQQRQLRPRRRRAQNGELEELRQRDQPNRNEERLRRSVRD